MHKAHREATFGHDCKGQPRPTQRQCVGVPRISPSWSMTSPPNLESGRPGDGPLHMWPTSGKLSPATSTFSVASDSQIITWQHSFAPMLAILDCYTLDCPPPHWRWCWQTKSRPNHGPMPPAPLQRPDSSCMTLVQLTPKTRPPPSCPLKISSAMVCWKDFAQTQL